MKQKQEKLIKSKERVRDKGEVFTPSWIVKDMCDLIPESEWTIESKFLEPCCGNGNFLAEIAERKFALCETPKDGLKALASIVGIDIMQDNVDESRARLLRLYIEHFQTASDTAILLASGIIKNNIMQGDSLKIMGKWSEENNEH